MSDDAKDEVAQLRRRILAGETSRDLWLTPPEVAPLIPASRGTVHNRIKEGRVRTRPKVGGKWRVCHPADVRDLLIEAGWGDEHA